MSAIEATNPIHAIITHSLVATRSSRLAGIVFARVSDAKRQKKKPMASPTWSTFDEGRYHRPARHANTATPKEIHACILQAGVSRRTMYAVSFMSLAPLVEGCGAI